MIKKLSKKLLDKSGAQQALPATPDIGEGAPCAYCPPMSNLRYEYATNLQYKVRSLSAQVKAFETGDKYTQMKAESNKQLA